MHYFTSTIVYDLSLNIGRGFLSSTFPSVGILVYMRSSFAAPQVTIQLNKIGYVVVKYMGTYVYLRNVCIVCQLRVFSVCIVLYCKISYSHSINILKLILHMGMYRNTLCARGIYTYLYTIAYIYRLQLRLLYILQPIYNNLGGFLIRY